MFNKNFFPTPRNFVEYLREKYLYKDYKRILDPSAGKGDLLKPLMPTNRHYYRGNSAKMEFFAIEIEPELQKILKLTEHMSFIGADFLAFNDQIQFDLILMNPPFDKGDRHLLKAIDVMHYTGDILCILNAETLRNPCTPTRRTLVSKLNELNADVQYHKNIFKDAERKTNVEIAVVWIEIKHDVTDDAFFSATQAAEWDGELEQSNDISVGANIHGLIAAYNHRVELGIKSITEKYKYHHLIGEYIDPNWKHDEESSDSSKNSSLTERMKTDINKFLWRLRNDYWGRVLEFPEAKSKMTYHRRKRFDMMRTNCTRLDFTYDNIRNFLNSLHENYSEDLLLSATDMFDYFTKEFSYCGDSSDNVIGLDVGEHERWKTNKPFVMNKKIILPLSSVTSKLYYSGCGELTCDYRGWRGNLEWGVRTFLDDIDKICETFYDKSHVGFISSADAMQNALEAVAESRNPNDMRNIESTFFKMSAYKKGTIHLTFRDLDVLRRWNLAVCKERNWVGYEYGEHSYDDLDDADKDFADAFEGKKKYQQNVGKVSGLIAGASGVPRLI